MADIINPSDDNKINPSHHNKIPPKSQELSFHLDYTTPQQRVMNEHINELKNLLKHEDPHDPEIQQRIAHLRYQIQYEDLPAVGLSERRKPTISDAMDYIDRQSGYTAHVEKMTTLEATSSKKSKKSGRRQLAGLTATSVSLSKTKPKLGSSDTSLTALENAIKTWKTHNPAKIDAQCDGICAIIDQLKNRPGGSKVDADGVRSLIQLSHDPNVNALFNTRIYQEISKTDLGNFFDEIGLDKSLLPDETIPTAPPFRAGYVAYVFKNLPTTSPDGKTETTIQIGGQMNDVQMFAIGIRPDGTPIMAPSNSINGIDPTLLDKHTFPTFTDSSGQKQSYVYVPAGLTSGRFYYNGSQNTYNTGFSEFSVDGNGVPYTNFTAVDGVPILTSNVQMCGTKVNTNRNGIQTDFKTFAGKIEALYNKYDPSGVWAKNMFAQDSKIVPAGSILAGKHMSDPAIIGSLSNYLSNTFMPQMAGQRIYFLADAVSGPPQTRSGMITRAPGGGWQFTFDGASTSPLPLPAIDDINGWISGAFGAAPKTDDPATAAAKWGIAKALSSIINKGILPSDIIGKTSQAKPMQGAFFTDPANIQNFYQAPFYNLYLRAMHEAGCSAYGADFDDYMGGDGTVSDDPSDEPAITINFYTSSPTPPAFDPNDVADKLFASDKTIASEWNQQNVVQQLTGLITQINQAITAYNKNPTLDAWNAINALYKNLAPLQINAGTAAYYMLTTVHASQFDAIVKAITGEDPTDDQTHYVAQAMATHEVTPVLPLPPSPVGPTPAQQTAKIYADTNLGFHNRFMNRPELALIQTDAKKYQTDLATYNAQKTPANYAQLQADANKYSQDLSALTPTVVKMLQANTVEIQSLGVDPSQYGDIAAYITGTQETSNIPTISPLPPPPVQPTPAQSTAKIYGDTNLGFHNRFMNRPELALIQTDAKKYQTDLATYNAQKTQANYKQLQADANKYSQDLSALTPMVVRMLQANTVEIQSLGVDPSQYGDIAAYITGTQEKSNIPTIAPLPPPPQRTIG